MAGDRVDVRASPSQEPGNILEALQGIKVHGASDFIRGIMTAQLALKHRQNKNQRQRIVVFVASPMNVNMPKLEQLGRALKKNNVSLDVVSLGEQDANADKIQRLLNAVNNQDTSHVVEVPQGAVVSEAVLASPILREPGDAAAPGGPGDMLDLEVDPSADPDLYMALRMSLEEENRRQREQAGVTGAEGGQGSAEETGGDSAMPDAGTAAVDEAAPINQEATTATEIENMESIDPELKLALLLSLRTEQSSSAAAAADGTANVEASAGDGKGTAGDTAMQPQPQAQTQSQNAAEQVTATGEVSKEKERGEKQITSPLDTSTKIQRDASEGGVTSQLGATSALLDPSSFSDPSFVQQITESAVDSKLSKNAQQADKEDKKEGDEKEKGKNKDKENDA